MSRYRRANTAGATYFFTVVAYRRQRILCDERVRKALRDAIVSVREKRPFTIDAWVLLPDHLHCMWTLPPDDADYSIRYFYTDTYDWVDIRHFAEAARYTYEVGQWGLKVKAQGFALEVKQWFSEWGDDYRSGFSPEDLPSNSAGIDFAQSIRPGQNLNEAFNLWAIGVGGRVIDDPRSGYQNLPLFEPSFGGGEGRGSNFSSTP